MDILEPFERSKEGIDTRLKSLEEHDADQAAQVDAGPVQVGVRCRFLLGRTHIMPESIPGIGQLHARIWLILLTTGAAEISANLAIEPLAVSVFDAVSQGFEFPLGEKLVGTRHHYIGPFRAVEVLFRF